MMRVAAADVVEVSCVRRVVMLNYCRNLPPNISRRTSNSNKHQTDSARGGMTVTSPPNDSFVFARWQNTSTDVLAAIRNCMFWQPRV